MKDVFKWNTRASAVYAFGIWTMIGSFAYFTYTGKYDGWEQKKKPEVDDPNVVVYKTALTEYTVTYKKDFVPYQTRIYNFVQSFLGGPGTGGGDEK